MAKMGKPRIPIDWDKAAKLASIHCTIADMAEVMGLSVDTLERAAKREHKMTIAAWCDQKRGSGRAALRNLQWKSAQSGNIAMQIWLGKQWLKQTDKMETVDTRWAEKQSKDDLIRLGREALAVLDSHDGTKETP